MAKDKEKEEREKKEEEQEEKSRLTWLQKVPRLWLIGGIAVIVFKWLSIRNAGGNMQELWIWIIIIIAVLYFIGSEGLRRESGILTPEEAYDVLDKHIVFLKKKGMIPSDAKIYLGPNSGLQWHEAMPPHYQIQIEITTRRGREYKRGVVIAEGPAKGYATLQDHLGRLTGREVIPVGRPQWMKDIKKYDLDIDKFIFGAKK